MLPAFAEAQVMTEESNPAWLCPKDGATMQPMGRRMGARRCPTCRGVFIDTEAMRRGRRPPMWSPLLMSIFWSLLATIVVRRLRRRPSKPSSAA